MQLLYHIKSHTINNSYELHTKTKKHLTRLSLAGLVPDTSPQEGLKPFPGSCWQYKTPTHPKELVEKPAEHKTASEDLYRSSRLS